MLGGVEGEEGEKWVREALNPVPARRMQQLLTGSGFDIVYWRAAKGRRDKNYPTLEIIRDSFETYPEISLEDLILGSIVFVAVKE